MDFDFGFGPNENIEVYLSCLKSLGAAQFVAQWARWKTVLSHSISDYHRDQKEGPFGGDIHSSTQFSFVGASLSCAAVTRPTHSS